MFANVVGISGESEIAAQMVERLFPDLYREVMDLLETIQLPIFPPCGPFKNDGWRCSESRLRASALRWVLTTRRCWNGAWRLEIGLSSTSTWNG